MAPITGFSISIVPPHFAHFVRALGRVPSLDSSNLYRAEQDGQTMIIEAPLKAPRVTKHNTDPPPFVLRCNGLRN
jgi:hypothetical protein